MATPVFPALQALQRIICNLLYILPYNRESSLKHFKLSLTSKTDKTMNLQQYLNLSNEEYEFILENAELKELETLYFCLDSANRPILERSAMLERLLGSPIRDKYLTEFNRRKDNMSK